MLNRNSTVGRPCGFTLIEVMITIAILAMALALGAPAVSTWMQNTQVRTVAESVQNGLQAARNEALRRNQHVEFTISTDTSWTVTAKVPGSADVIVQQRTSHEGSSANVTAALTGSATAAFNGLGRIDNATPLTQVDVASSIAGTKKLRVQLGSGGQIRMCDPDLDLVVTTDPRKCQ